MNLPLLLRSGMPPGLCPGPRAYAAGGPARAAPEGLAPLDSLSRLRAGMGFLLVVPAAGIQPAIRAAGWIDFL
ncbi:hypothetical protein D7X33_18145 [Butyricicoccus sp. 1XD8-22]|nr:hypothetical protein D7X33_18145 [Butyricicoccus sp. 1XD8-22]